MFRIQVNDFELWAATSGSDYWMYDPESGDIPSEEYRDMTREEAVQSFLDEYGGKADNLIVTEFSRTVIEVGSGEPDDDYDDDDEHVIDFDDEFWDDEIDDWDSDTADEWDDLHE